jgi:alpha-tubulin suppressor-like RCC1 family protein
MHPQERSREMPTAHALASRAADMGGAIFTWGGDFRWQQRWAKDHHQGCLGVGDLSGRLVPTLVKGEDNHVQVACGLNFTVALTNNGEVYQMGTTGAQNNRERDKADWKVRLWAMCLHCEGILRPSAVDVRMT